MQWRLLNDSAVGTVGNSYITVFPRSPMLSAKWYDRSNQEEAWNIAAITPRPVHRSQLEEVYVRGSDLIVRYLQSQADTFAYQLDWHLLEPHTPFVAAVELWISVQTDLLDTQPELEIACTANVGQNWQSFEHLQLIDSGFDSNGIDGSQRSPAALLCSSSGAGAIGRPNGLWLIEPSDQQHTRCSTTVSQATQSVQLFGRFMEKGVIRRARMRFLLAPGTITLERIRQAYRDLANSPLPLTA